jgi:hypothetical protein
VSPALSPGFTQQPTPRAPDGPMITTRARPGRLWQCHLSTWGEGKAYQPHFPTEKSPSDLSSRQIRVRRASLSAPQETVPTGHSATQKRATETRSPEPVAVLLPSTAIQPRPRAPETLKDHLGLYPAARGQLPPSTAP